MLNEFSHIPQIYRDAARMEILQTFDDCHEYDCSGDKEKWLDECFEALEIPTWFEGTGEVESIRPDWWPSLVKYADRVSFLVLCRE